MVGVLASMRYMPDISIITWYTTVVTITLVINLL